MRLSAYPYDLAVKTGEKIRGNRRFTIISLLSLSSLDYRLFPTMKTWLANVHFSNDSELEADANDRLNDRAVQFYRDGIRQRYDKCLNSKGDYTKEKCKSVRFKCM